jgi:hypothetical protein
MNRAACTIVSYNYLAYARTLCRSFRRFHPDHGFYVLMVDRLPENFDASREEFELVLVENLEIPNFNAVAFRYGVLELNTNVKPSFLKRLLALGVDELIYFDPDILVCSSVDPIYSALSVNGILLTPHCMSPNEHDASAEALLLINGVFNLGFIAVSRTMEVERFLTWWEHRCLSLGYDERWSGLFVDQKWINLAPCYFQSVQVLTHPGCNVAYWNLHERILERSGAFWVVNGTELLIFFHFSGISVDGGDRISRHTDRFDLVSRSDLRELFANYRGLLVANGIRDVGISRYAFGRFDNGATVTKLQRAAFAANLDKFELLDPFDASGPFYRWLKQKHLQSDQDSVGKYGRKAYSQKDFRIRFVNGILRLALRLLGADRYTILMKYLEFASVLRNQKDIFT